MCIRQVSRVLFSSLAVLVASVVVAVAATLDFENGVYSREGPSGSEIQVYTEQGFRLETPVGNHFDSNTFPGNGIAPGAPYLMFHEAASNPVNNLITLSFGGAAFDLIGFDLVDDPRIRSTFNPIINPQMLISGSGGQTMLSPTAAAPGFIGTVNVNFLNVTSITFDITQNSTVVGNVLLDNLVVRPAGPTTNEIPLSATGWLLLAGFGALGGLRRRSG